MPDAGMGGKRKLMRDLEAGSWKLETGSWKLEAGNWKLEKTSKLKIAVSRF
jgi:hypothetical protein